jgi:large subunit ribosomal protein L10
MAMTKEQKASEVQVLVERLQNSSTIYLTNYSGLSVDQVTQLRSRFRDAGVEYSVVKNTLLKRAMEEIGGYDEIFDKLAGPTAVAFTEDPSGPARVIKKFLAEMKLEIPSLKGAHVEGAVYDATALESLAKLKSKTEILGEIVALLQSPISNIVGGLQAQGSTLVGAIKTIAEREEA